MSLYDYGLGTLAQYELTADRSARTRGALLCYTAQGLLILREFHGSAKKLEKQQELLMRLQENGINTDYFLRNNQESLVSKDKTEQRFTLQHWYEGKECDTKFPGRYFKKCPDTGKVTYFNENGTCGGIQGKISQGGISPAQSGAS